MNMTKQTVFYVYDWVYDPNLDAHVMRSLSPDFDTEAEALDWIENNAYTDGPYYINSAVKVKFDD